MSKIRILFLFLLCGFLASLMGIAPEHSKNERECCIASIKSLEKNVALQTREVYRFEGDFLLKRLPPLVVMELPKILSQFCKWQHQQPLLVDCSYYHCNLSILASKHHPPTLC